MTSIPEILSATYVEVSSNPLRMLCQHHGIATEYADVWGEIHRVPEDCLVGLLAGFDIDASSLSAARRALAEIKAKKWSACLPAICAVQTANARWRIELRISSSTGELRWHIALEDGQTVSGSVSVACAPTITMARIGGVELREIDVEIVASLPTGYHRFKLTDLAGENLRLQQVIDMCHGLGMAVGLYLDLAVSVDSGGSDTWGAADFFAMKACVGAPADAFNPNGQDWGLLPMRPDRLRAEGYRYFIETRRKLPIELGAADEALAAMSRISGARRPRAQPAPP